MQNETPPAEQQEQTRAHLIQRTAEHLAGVMHRFKEHIFGSSPEPYTPLAVSEPEPEFGPLHPDWEEFVRKSEERAEIQRRKDEYRSPTYLQLDELMSEEARRPKIDALRQELDSEADYRALAWLDRRLDTTLPQDLAQARGLDDKPWIEDLISQRTALENERAGIPQESKSRYGVLDREFDVVARQKLNTVDADDPGAQDLLTALADAPSIHNVDSDNAPYKDYHANSDTSWAYVSDDQVRSYLSSLEFRNESSLSSWVGEGGVIINPAEGQTFDIPLRTFINVTGFDSWLGRPEWQGKDWVLHTPEGSVLGDGRSLTAIKHYAALPTEVPPVRQVRVMVQPNGIMLCDNMSGDSHRVAAAILKGQSTIKAEQVIFRPMKYNLIDRDLPEVQG